MRLFILFLALASSGCERKKEIWIYTSLYREVISEMEPLVHAAFPDVEVNWYQAGSESVAETVSSELAAGTSRADLILTSDPLWYSDLKQNGKLLAYESPAAKDIPVEYQDPDHSFTTVRIPVVVMGYNSEVFKPTDLPKTWKDLGLPIWKDKIAMGSPIESGTSFIAISMLSKLYGWGYFSELRKNNIIAAGGNSSVVTRIETRERPIGAVLLESVLQAMKKGSPVRPLYPTDGVIPVPSPIAIFKDTKEPELAKKIYDWFFSPAAQNAMIRSGMYSPMPGSPMPEKGMAWSDLKKQMAPWSAKTLAEIYLARDQTRAKFSEYVLH